MKDKRAGGVGTECAVGYGGAVKGEIRPWGEDEDGVRCGAKRNVGEKGVGTEKI